MQKKFFYLSAILASLTLSTIVQAQEYSCEVYSDVFQSVKRELDDFNKGPYKALKDRYEAIEKDLKWREARPKAIDKDVEAKNKRITTLEAQNVDKAASAGIHRAKAVSQRALAAQSRAQGKEQQAKLHDKEALSEENTAKRIDGDIAENIVKIDAIKLDVATLTKEKTDLPMKRPLVSELTAEKAKLDGDNKALLSQRNEIKTRMDNADRILNMCKDVKCVSMQYTALKNSVLSLRADGCGARLEWPDNQCERDGINDARRIMNCQ